MRVDQGWKSVAPLLRGELLEEEDAGDSDPIRFGKEGLPLSATGRLLVVVLTQNNVDML